jgi:hypothetical protein
MVRSPVPHEGRGWFFRLRVAVLVAILVAVALYAGKDYLDRRSRNDWDRTLKVAIVVLELEPVAPSALEAMRARLPSLEARLAAELHRYRPGAPFPFEFELFGPVPVNQSPPEPKSESFFDLSRHSFGLWRYVSAVDRELARTTGDGGASQTSPYDAANFDSRVYVVVRPPAKEAVRLVEGMSQQNGRVGTVSVELADDMADLALFVASHELFHTLGASDKYDAQGRVLVPGGLVEPAKNPLYPQRYAEIMARNRPLSLTEEVLPETLDELAVGRDTALEIGWLEQ